MRTYSPDSTSLVFIPQLFPTFSPPTPASAPSTVIEPGLASPTTLPTAGVPDVDAFPMLSSCSPNVLPSGNRMLESKCAIALKLERDQLKRRGETETERPSQRESWLFSIRTTLTSRFVRSQSFSNTKHDPTRSSKIGIGEFFGKRSRLETFGNEATLTMLRDQTMQSNSRGVTDIKGLNCVSVLQVK